MVICKKHNQDRLFIHTHASKHVSGSQTTSYRVELRAAQSLFENKLRQRKLIIKQDNKAIIEGCFLEIPIRRQAAWKRTKKMPIAACDDWMEIAALLHQCDSVIFNHTRAHGKGS